MRMYTYTQAHTDKNVVHDDEWSTEENFRQRHDEDGERAINFDERKKEERLRWIIFARDV